MLRVLIAAGATVVAEAAFQDPLWRRGLEPLSRLGEHTGVATNALRKIAPSLARLSMFGVLDSLLPYAPTDHRAWSSGSGPRRA